MDKNFGGVIWTNHALQRLNERGIKQGDAWAVWNRPDQSRKSSSGDGSWVYYRTWGDTKIEVVAKQNEKKEWIILSVWSKKVQLSDNSFSSDQSILTRLLKLFKVKHGK